MLFSSINKSKHNNEFEKNPQVKIINKKFPKENLAISVNQLIYGIKAELIIKKGKKTQQIVIYFNEKNLQLLHLIIIKKKRLIVIDLGKILVINDNSPYKLKSNFAYKFYLFIFLNKKHFGIIFKTEEQRENFYHAIQFFNLQTYKTKIMYKEFLSCFYILLINLIIKKNILKIKRHFSKKEFLIIKIRTIRNFL